MDPITLIVAASAAGARLEVQDAGSAMGEDAYAGLKVLVEKRLGGVGADSDRDLITAAEALLDLVSIAKGAPRKCTVDVRGLRACTSGITTGRTARSTFRQAAGGRGR